MAYDDLKEFNGRKYMGMRVGGRHAWVYPNGIWTEQKVKPDRWMFRFESLKRRTREAPMNSGVPVNTQYRWFILADQRVRKIGKDEYETMMEGMKCKVSHKRPHWHKWSSEYPDNTPEREKIIRILEDVLERLKDNPRCDSQSAASICLSII